ncbi:MAG: hypothetical protein ACO1OG_07080 [Devosia sp.]
MKALLLAAALLATPALAAGPIEFSSEPNPALSIARTLMGEEQGEPLEDDEVVTIALIDLDEDGTNDIFAFAETPYFCGTAGCVPRLYRLNRDTAKWEDLPFETDALINAAPENWSVAPAHAGTWKVLELRTDVVRLYFAWNGSAFVQVQRP